MIAAASMTIADLLRTADAKGRRREETTWIQINVTGSGAIPNHGVIVGAPVDRSNLLCAISPPSPRLLESAWVQIDMVCCSTAPEQGVGFVARGRTAAITDLLRTADTKGRTIGKPAGVQIDVVVGRSVPEYCVAAGKHTDLLSIASCV